MALHKQNELLLPASTLRSNENHETSTLILASIYSTNAKQTQQTRCLNCAFLMVTPVHLIPVCCVHRLLLFARSCIDKQKRKLCTPSSTELRSTQHMGLLTSGTSAFSFPLFLRDISQFFPHKPISMVGYSCPKHSPPINLINCLEKHDACMNVFFPLSLSLL